MLLLQLSFCDAGSSGSCHPLYATEVLSVCWPRAFAEQSTHPNRIGWAQVIQLFPQRQIIWDLHLWTLLIHYDACVEPHHFTCGDELHFVTTGEWYKTQKRVLEQQRLSPSQALTVNNQITINWQTVVSEILNEAQGDVQPFPEQQPPNREVEQVHFYCLSFRQELYYSGILKLSMVVLSN